MMAKKDRTSKVKPDTDIRRRRQGHAGFIWGNTPLGKPSKLKALDIIPGTALVKGVKSTLMLPLLVVR